MIHKLKIVKYSIPIALESNSDGEKVIKEEINTELWVEVETEDFEIDSEHQNVQLKIKEYADNVRKFNHRAEVMAKTNNSQTMHKKILTKQKGL